MSRATWARLAKTLPGRTRRVDGTNAVLPQGRRTGSAVGGAGPAAPMGGGGDAPSDFGSYGPAAPAVAGLTLAWDFDLGYEPLGAMRAEIPSRAGNATAATIIPMSAGLEIVGIDATRRALRFTTALSTLARILYGLAAMNEASPDITLAAVFHRRTAGVAHTLLDVNAGLDSGAALTESLNRYRLRVGSGDTISWSRADGSNTASATLGTVVTNAAPGPGTRNIVVARANLAADLINRGLLNAGAKASSPSRATGITQWSNLLLGAQGLWNGGSSGYQTFNQFADVDLERLFLYAGAGADADLDTIRDVLVGGYV